MAFIIIVLLFSAAFAYAVYDTQWGKPGFDDWDRPE